jgi:hypothetical protein
MEATGRLEKSLHLGSTNEGTALVDLIAVLVYFLRECGEFFNSMRRILAILEGLTQGLWHTANKSYVLANDDHI